ncbi:hypothetical protein GCM10023085_73340 [Actinomadura viridis]
MDHAPVEVTHWIYQQLIAAYGHPDPARADPAHPRIDTIRAGVPAGLEAALRTPPTLDPEEPL